MSIAAKCTCGKHPFYCTGEEGCPKRLILPVPTSIPYLAEFEVQRLTNGKGESHLVVITYPAIEDVAIGSVLIVPYAQGFREPVKVRLQLDENGNPKIANGKFAIVLEYIYE